MSYDEKDMYIFMYYVEMNVVRIKLNYCMFCVLLAVSVNVHLKNCVHFSQYIWAEVFIFGVQIVQVITLMVKECFWPSPLTLQRSWVRQHSSIEIGHETILFGCGSSIGSVFAWHASSPEFDPQVRHILSWRLGHENISTAVFPLPLIQEEQLSVTGERMCTKYW